jgi:2-hydroxy-3-keto-5-methylthiopentenyl-1-phosphate phosphatase
MRDYWKEFMDFLKENDDYFEPVIYTSGLKPYTERILNILDPKYQLYQNACYIFEVKEENLLFLIKDISRFRNRNIKRSLLLDSKA